MLRKKMSCRHMAHPCFYKFISLILSAVYRPMIADATRKYTSKDSASTMVVIKGLAMTAGSKPRRFARTGSKQPIIMAITTAAINVRHTETTCGKVKIEKLKETYFVDKE